MSYLETIKQKHQQARLARDKVAVTTLGILLGDVQTAEKKGELITEDSMEQMLITTRKNINEMISVCHPEQRDNWLRQKEIIDDLLPKMLTPEQMTQIAKDAGFTSWKPAMTYFKENYFGKYDGNLLREEMQKTFGK